MGSLASVSHLVSMFVALIMSALQGIRRVVSRSQAPLIYYLYIEISYSDLINCLFTIFATSGWITVILSRQVMGFLKVGHGFPRISCIRNPVISL